MSTTPTLPKFWPDVSSEAGPKTHFAITMQQTAIQELNDSIVQLKSQLTAASAGATAAAAVTTPLPTTNNNSTFNLGRVNNQTGTLYTVQDSDYGGIVTFNNPAPVAVTLNPAVRQFWFGAFENLGAGLATITPGSGTINGIASIALATNIGAWLFYDGVNWWAATSISVPIATASILGIVRPDNTTITVSGGVLTAVAGGGGPVVTTNANGTSVNFGAWVHQFGNAGPSATGVARTSFPVNFPVPFAGIPRVICQPTNVPDAAYGTAVFDSYPTSITTTGFIANLTSGVTIGGGGPSNIVTPTFVDWMADFA